MIVFFFFLKKKNNKKNNFFGFIYINPKKLFFLHNHKQVFGSFPIQMNRRVSSYYKNESIIIQQNVKEQLFHHFYNN
jgi:hypothetical protein